MDVPPPKFNETTCEIQGNGDIYGLGVRLGIYFQWATAILTENLNQADLPATRAAGNCYQIAMLAGLIRISQYPEDDVLVLEGFIVLLFCFAGVWAASFGLQGLGEGNKAEDEVEEDQKNRFGTLISVVLGATICAYGTWFLFVGMHRMNRQTGSCEEKVFFFAQASLFGWVLTILKVFFIASLVGSAMLLAYRGYEISQRVDLLLGGWKDAKTTPGTGDGRRSSQDVPENSRVEVRAVKLVGSVLALGVFVTSIELTLHWNHVVDVYSCDNFSQVFPFAIGASGLARVLVDLGKKLMVKDLELSMRW